jgi:trimethylamine--corrinoid protein Co-methyltransferase
VGRTEGGLRQPKREDRRAVSVGAEHTLARFETAFHHSMTADLRPFQTCAEDGARTAADRGNRIWKSLLEHYEPPPLDPSTAEAIDAFVDCRKREITAG